ncbi:DUF6318 family protein [Janibacter terrae]|uniref:DUF6318 family protein n=1 Tax=Janibacter terrae TaxID=103817 RepID=UPI000829C163|nr:DUF6318 family protein [Janibacter terrae]
MQFSRGAAALAATAVLTGGLAACGEDEPTEPTTTASPIEVDPSSSSSSGPSVSPTSTGAGAEMPKDLPAAARKETKAGAAAFGKYYYEAMGDASHTGETEELVKLSLKSCPPCEQVLDDIEADAKINRTRGEDPYRFANVRATKRPDAGYKVSMDVTVRAHKVYEDGKVIGSVDPLQYKLTEHVIWSNGRWQVSDWVIS